MRISLLTLGLLLGFCVTARAQTAPVANAGPDVVVGCAGQSGTPINLNGMGSSIGSEFTYLWTAPGVSFNSPTSLTPIGTFPVGTTTATLTVTSTDPASGATATASDTVDVTVTDTTPPMVLATADPSQLWPPNHKLHDIHVSVLSFDACDAEPAIELVSISSSEADNGQGDGNTSGDIQGADVGSDDRDFALRAERSGPGSGRVYSALYRATDLAGNTSDSLVLITVPHDQGNHGGAGSGNDDAEHDTKKAIAQAKKDALKQAKVQLKAAKKLAKQQAKAYKAALKAAND